MQDNVKTIFTYLKIMFQQFSHVLVFSYIHGVFICTYFNFPPTDNGFTKTPTHGEYYSKHCSQEGCSCAYARRRALLRHIWQTTRWRGQHEALRRKGMRPLTRPLSSTNGVGTNCGDHMAQVSNLHAFCRTAAFVQRWKSAIGQVLTLRLRNCLGRQWRSGYPKTRNHPSSFQETWKVSR